jgi:GT2 family glycosyltransferase
MFGNFNRAIESARGKWVTILNDDDLLDANYLELMFQTLDGDESVDGLVCHKRFFDQRPGADQARPGDAAPQFHSRRINFASARRMLFGGKGSLGRFARHAGRRLQFEYSFRGQVTRRIHPGKLFWGAILGNGAGFIFRRDKAIELGGFQPEEFPSADYWFFARFAKRYHLRQHRAVAASVRKAENETAKLETVRAAFRNAFALQKALAGREVPAWWMRLAPLIMARDRVDFRDQWAAELPRVEVEKELQISLPKERPRLLYALQTVLRGF